ncbi:hypothetical protein C8D77_11338 [Mesorhizobium loti]|uniref:Uncharacterized protein n=1 Tax=Rhizobium loti TaxID=381 RepID=A0A8E2W9S9_RHILI|nr:hypothetical protein C8D77_11338 [Mesorhizobium loti]
MLNVVAASKQCLLLVSLHPTYRCSNACYERPNH